MAIYAISTNPELHALPPTMSQCRDLLPCSSMGAFRLRRHTHTHTQHRAWICVNCVHESSSPRVSPSHVRSQPRDSAYQLRRVTQVWLEQPCRGRLCMAHATACPFFSLLFFFFTVFMARMHQRELVPNNSCPQHMIVTIRACYGCLVQAFNSGRSVRRCKCRNRMGSR